MKWNYINIKILNDFYTGLTGIDQVNNRTKMIDKKDKMIGSYFAFFKNFYQLTLQNPTNNLYPKFFAKKYNFAETHNKDLER